MRWKDVPFLHGPTDPHGTVVDPYSGFGSIPSIRLAASEPELVGQDPIPYLEHAGYHGQTGGQDKPPPPPQKPTGTGPILPGPPGPGGGPGGGTGPRGPGGGTTINWLTADSGPFMPSRSTINWPGGGPTKHKDPGEYEGYGADVIAGNNYGQVLFEKRSNTASAIADVLETLRQAGKKAGLDTAAAISVREGVPVTEAALEVISTKRMDAPELKRRIAGVKAQYKTAKAKGRKYEASNHAVRLAALRARLKDVQSGKQQAIADDKAIAGDSSRIPPWVTYASLAVGVVGLGVALMGLNKGKKK